MQPLAELQRALAESLTGRAAAPPGFDGSQIAGARRALEAKRRRAAAHLLPRLRHVLGDELRRHFHEHALAYAPDGLLYHVDDAWAFAERCGRDTDPRVRHAALDDRLALRLRWVRTARGGPDRFRERRAPLIAFTREAPRALIVRFPGAAGRTLRLPIR